MKKRQVLAVVLSAAMVMGSSMTALAATGAASGDATWGGTGDVSYVDTTVYNVKLPTNQTVQKALVVDPQGLSKLEKGKAATAEQLAADAGIITCAHTPIVQNLSSVPMKVSVKMAVSGDATPVDAVNKVNSGDAQNILLYAVPSKVDATSGDLYQPSSTGIVLENSEVTAEFILGAAAYNFKKDTTGDVTYEAVSGDVGHGTGLQFGGYVNKKGNWADYAGASATKTISMTAKFHFSEPAAGETAASGDAYAMKALASGVKTVTIAPKNAAPTFTTGSAAGSINYTAGAGDDGLKTITSITMLYDGTPYDGYNALAGTWAAATNSNGVITFDSAYTSTYAGQASAPATQEATITYVTTKNETKTATVNVKLR